MSIPVFRRLFSFARTGLSLSGHAGLSCESRDRFPPLRPRKGMSVQSFFLLMKPIVFYGLII